MRISDWSSDVCSSDLAGAVLRRRVALVALPAIAGELLGVGGHGAVAGHLGDDGGGGDAEGEAVALHHGARRAGQLGKLVAVDQGAMHAARGRKGAERSEARRVGKE